VGGGGGGFKREKELRCPLWEIACLSWKGSRTWAGVRAEYGEGDRNQNDPRKNTHVMKGKVKRRLKGFATPAFRWWGEKGSAVASSKSRAPRGGKIRERLTLKALTRPEGK